MYLIAKPAVEWVGSTPQVAAGRCGLRWQWSSVVLLPVWCGCRTEVRLPFVSKRSAPDRSPQEVSGPRSYETLGPRACDEPAVEQVAEARDRVGDALASGVAGVGSPVSAGNGSTTRS